MHYVAREQVSVASLIPSPAPTPKQHTDLDLNALRSLDFFLHSTAIELEQPFGTGLWSKTISCFLHSQPAVKHGLIALAAFHENYQHASDETYAEKRRVLALEHYGLSINGIVQFRLEDAKESLGLTLLASLLFCLIESLQGHYSSALKHVAAGIDLLRQSEKDLAVADYLPGDMLQALRQVFISLSMQAIALEDTVVLPAALRFMEQSLSRTSCTFRTVEQALAEVTHIQIDAMRVLAWAQSPEEDLGCPSPPLLQAATALKGRFYNWTTKFHDLIQAQDDGKSPQDDRRILAILALRLNEHVTKIIVHVIFRYGQTTFDALTDDFEAVVSYAEEIARIESQLISGFGKPNRPVFNLAIGIVPALYYTCTRCRDHSIRHRALSCLRDTKRREVVWDASLVASVAEAVIAIEEQATENYLSELAVEEQDCDGRNAAHRTGNLPESERIARVEVEFHHLENAAEIVLIDAGGSNKHQGTLVWSEY